MLRSRTVLADCDPEPFTVATWILKSFTLRRPSRVCAACSRMPTSTVAMKYSRERPERPPLALLSLSTFFRVTETYIIKQRLTSHYEMPGHEGSTLWFNQRDEADAEVSGTGES